MCQHVCALHGECSGNVEWALRRTKTKVSKGTRVQPTEPKTFALLSFQEEASGASQPGNWWRGQHTCRMSSLSRFCSLWVVQLLSCLSTLVTRNFFHFPTSSGFRLGGAQMFAFWCEGSFSQHLFCDLWAGTALLDFLLYRPGSYSRSCSWKGSCGR